VEDALCGGFCGFFGVSEGDPGEGFEKFSHFVVDCG